MKFYIFDEKIFSVLKSIRRRSDRSALIDVLTQNLFKPVFENHGSSYQLDYGSINGLSQELKAIFKILYASCSKIAGVSKCNQPAFELLQTLDDDTRFDIVWALAVHYFEGKEVRICGNKRVIFDELKSEFDVALDRLERKQTSAKQAADARWHNSEVIHHEMPKNATDMRNDAEPMRNNATECEQRFPLMVPTPSLSLSQKDCLSLLCKKTRPPLSLFPNFEKFWKQYPHGHRRKKAKALDSWKRLKLEDDPEPIFSALYSCKRSQAWLKSEYIPNGSNFIEQKEKYWDSFIASKVPLNETIEYIHGKWLGE